MTTLKIGAAIVIGAALAAAVGPLLTPFDPAAQDLALRLAGPSAAHWFGLDEMGRDILARVLAGARISFLVGLTVVSVSASVGTLLGAIAGYSGGVTDDAIRRVIDVLLAFPGQLLAIALVAVLGPSLGNVLFALTIIVGSATRGSCAARCCARDFEYVQAARAAGAATPRILWQHVIPAAIPVVVVQATLGMAGAIIGEAALSVLGLGVQAPTPSWGTMLNGGRAHLLDAPHLTIVPGLAIAILVLGFNFLGDGLRDATDPKQT